MSLSIAIVLSAVLALAFAIVYSEQRIRALRQLIFQRDECLRFAILVAAHRAGDQPLVEKIESFSEDQQFDDDARRAAFELEPKDSEAAKEAA